MTTLQKIIKYLALAFALFIILNIVSSIWFGVYYFADFLGLSTQTKTTFQEEAIVNRFEEEGVLRLDIDLAYSDLILKKGDKLSIETNSSNIKSVRTSSGLHITEEKRHYWFLPKETNKVIVYLPEKVFLEEVKIDAGVGSIQIETLKTEELRCELGAGRVEIEELEVTKKAKIEGGAGNVRILSGEIHDLDLDIGVGAFDLIAKLTGKNKIDAGVGKLRIEVEDSLEHYTIKVNRGIGSINMEGKEVSDGVEYGTGETYIKLNGGIGSIEIKEK